jgi:uncharacterized protein GlcG (DUF336 family)
MAPSPAASKQRELWWARELCDKALAAASARGLLVSVTVVDRGGDPIQQDRMDDAVSGSVDIAFATAATAARFGCESAEVSRRYGSAAGSLGALHPAPFLAAHGGVPLLSDGHVVGGLGVGGLDPEACAEIAREVAGL